MVRRRRGAAGRASVKAPVAARLMVALLMALLASLPASSWAQEAEPAGEPGSLPQRAVTIDTEEARALAQRYAPVAMLRVQATACDTDGEPYSPAPVTVAFGDPDVALRENDGGPQWQDTVLAAAPVADDLAAAGPGTYLDFPGNPRRPGCAYETWFRANATQHEPTVYARVVEADTGHVVIQYHLYYVFNDFNNTHESDWEMIQLRFDVPTVSEALAVEPAQVAYAQHAGGETADWDADKLTREGDRPVVFVAAGSHASQYGSETYLGWGANGTGFGCDDTQAPLHRVALTPVLLTASPDEPGSDQAWLAWPGRWGERQPWEYNGPRGPAMSPRWADPVGWQDDLRDSSIVVPGSARFGESPTDLFCTLSELGSLALTRWAVAPWTVGLTAAGTVALLVGLLALSWRTIRLALGIYRRHLPVFALFGLLLIPIGLLVSGVKWVVTELPPGSTLLALMGDSEDVADFGFALSFGSVQQLASLLVIGPAVLVVYRAIERGQTPTVSGTLRGVRQRLVLMARAWVRPILKIALASLTIIGLPWAIERTIRWNFVTQAVVLDDVAPPEAAATSAATVRGRWWRTAITVVTLALIGAAPGPVLGIVLMVTDFADVTLVNTLSSVIYAVVLPFSVLGGAVLYRQRHPIEHPEEIGAAS